MSTLTPISTQTLSANTASITFSGIPQTYTDLVLVMNGGMNTTTGFALSVELNGDSSNSYSATHIFGNGSSASSGRYTNNPAMYLGAPALNNLNGNFILQFENYSNVTTNKTVLARTNAAANSVWASVGLWRNTAAITSIRLYPETASWLSGSTFTLYGIGAGSPKAFGGDEVRTDGTYWYHTYRSSGIFAPVENLTDVDFLVVAGGGGGGRGDVNNNGGGGGAGGYRTSVGASGGGASAQSKLSLINGTNYAIVVGGGGSGAASDYTLGTNGSASSFFTVSTTGGGGGGAVNASPTGQGRAGGSGGGSGDFNNAYAGGAGTANEGFAGGSGIGAQGNSRNMGGGGGAGAAGSSYVTQTGGSGLTSTITGTSVTRAVGGNGSDSGGAGTANTGNGGNGGRSTAGAGGSGTVIVRYAV
jgi:hypothetical protein